MVFVEFKRNSRRFISSILSSYYGAQCILQLLVGGVVGDELSESLSSLQALSMSAKEVINKSESFRIGFFPNGLNANY